MVLQYGNRFDSAAERLITEVVKERKWLKFLAIALFVAVGAIFSVTMVEPTTIKQALAAGMAWTTLLGIRAPKKKA